MRDENAPQAQERFTTTAISGNVSPGTIHDKTSAPPTEFLGSKVRQLYQEYKNARASREATWLEAWATYFGTPEAEEFLRSRVAKLIGDINDDWRHRVASGKGYEIVETINAYLQTAFFPSSEWFDVVPAEDPELEDVAKITQKLVMKKLREAQFQSYWELYIRQLLIVGFSVIALPWETRLVKRKRRVEVETPDGPTYPAIEEEVPEYDNIALEVLDSFDCYLDPIATDLNKANFIRVIRQTKADIMRKIATGEYDKLDPAAVAKHNHIGNNRTKQVSRFLGLEYYPDDEMELLEFWGDITVGDHTYHDVVITVAGNDLARIEPNPYWGGKPFIMGSAIPVPGRPYGMSPLEPVLGMVHQLNVLNNQRLDNLELLIDQMWGYIPDGVVDAANLVTEPGKIIPMAEPGNVFPLERGGSSIYVSYEETNLLESNIDKTVGVGAYIGTQQGRKGERVTASEIQAVRDAGGNRLASIHGHIELTQLHNFLQKVMASCRQFVTYDEVLRYKGKAGQHIYAQIGPRELMYDYDIMPVGAEYIANKERQLQQVISFIELVAQMEQFSQKINWDEMLRMVAKRFGFKEDIDRFIMSEEESAQPALDPANAEAAVQQQMTPPANGDIDSLAQRAFAQGGTPAINAMQGAAAIQGPEQAISQMME
jgi:hypothetical protein